MSEVYYRDKCLAAKEEVCKICGTDSGIVVHHIDGDRDNNDIDNLMPVCWGCHTRIHRGGEGVEEWSAKIPATARSDLPAGRTAAMRPNIQISHSLNGRVKDYAAENDMTTSEAYREIITAGLEVVESGED